MLDLNDVLVLSEDIVLRGCGEKFWALNTKNGNQYRLNEVSYFMLDMFRNPTRVSSMMDSMLSEYRVERNRLEADCDMIIRFAIEKNILEREV
jgi:hypothetical protein